MRVLIACEYSGTVRDAFRARGHHAVSCDLLPTMSPGLHYQGDVRDLLDGWEPVQFSAQSPTEWLVRAHDTSPSPVVHSRFGTTFLRPKTGV